MVGYPFFSSPAFIKSVGPDLATNLYNVNFGPDVAKYPDAKNVMDELSAEYGVKSLAVAPLLVTEAINTI
jgi:hypothetical protein